DHVHSERQVAHALGVEDALDLLRRLLEKRQVAAGGTAQSQQACATMVGGEPGRVELVMPRRTAEIPDVGIAVSGEQRIARQLVARPLADYGAGRIADIVLVERKQRAQSRLRQGRAYPREAVFVQSAEVDALLEIDLRAPRRLQRTVPAVLRVDVVRTHDLRLRPPRALRHSASSSGRFKPEMRSMRRRMRAAVSLSPASAARFS